MSKGIGGHQRAFKGKTNEWLTPPEIIKSLGKFDLDPCSPIDRPWDTADNHYTINDDGLSSKWFGRIWLNPPYGNDTGKWLDLLSKHGNGIALIFARTETEMFHKYGWNLASSMFFFRGRIYFCDQYGQKANNNAGGPSVLIAYGDENTEAIEKSGNIGALIKLR